MPVVVAEEEEVQNSDLRDCKVTFLSIEGYILQEKRIEYLPHSAFFSVIQTALIRNLTDD